MVSTRMTMNSPNISQEQRRQDIERMAKEGIDVLVIGGGITGAGVALDAAARGFRTGLVERGDFASGTSSKSTKLVHGGIRYLAQFDFALVREALVERGHLVRNAPFLVKPISFVLPLYKDNKRPLGTPIVPPAGIGMNYLLMAGLLLYDILAGRLGIQRFKHIGVQGALKLVPTLNPKGMTDAFIYYDAQTDDTVLTLTVLQTAHREGARLVNYAEVTSFEQTNGRITEAVVQDKLTNETHRIKVGAVINAGGVFAANVEKLTNGTPSVNIAPAKGVHLTIPREALQLRDDAIALPETEDGRVMFLVPWNTRITVGTTDTKGGDVEQPLATSEDVEYLLRHLNRYFDCNITTRDVISTWAGYRPLVSSNDRNKSTAKLSRTHVVTDGPSGIITVTGGKLTTFRRMAQDTVDHLCKRLGRPIRHVTQDVRLVGADNWQAAATHVGQVAAQYGWNEAIVQRLNQFGSRALDILQLIEHTPSLAQPIVADLPYLQAEVIYACRAMQAVTLADVLIRRTHLNFEDWSRGVEASHAVAQLMAVELGWDQAQLDRETEQYARLVQEESILAR